MNMNWKVGYSLHNARRNGYCRDAQKKLTLKISY